MHLISIKSKPGEIATGRNTQIRLDGKPLEGVTDIDFAVSGDSIAHVTITLVAEVDIELITKLVLDKSEGYDNPALMTDTEGT